MITGELPESMMGHLNSRIKRMQTREDKRTISTIAKGMCLCF